MTAWAAFVEVHEPRFLGWRAIVAESALVSNGHIFGVLLSGIFSGEPIYWIVVCLNEPFVWGDQSCQNIQQRCFPCFKIDGFYPHYLNLISFWSCVKSESHTWLVEWFRFAFRFLAKAPTGSHPLSPWPHLFPCVVFGVMGRDELQLLRRNA